MTESRIIRQIKRLGKPSSFVSYGLEYKYEVDLCTNQVYLQMRKAQRKGDSLKDRSRTDVLTDYILFMPRVSSTLWSVI